MIRKKIILSLAFVISLSTGCGGGTTGRNTGNEPSTGAALSGEYTRASAHRFLEQSTFGPSIESMDYARSVGFDGWIDEQFQLPPTLLLPQLRAKSNPRWAEYVNLWWKNTLNAPDQLRQRVAFALSEIFVISAKDGLGDEQEGVANYYDLLVRGAFGNFRDLMESVTLNPVMGEFLSMKGNHKPVAAQNIRPDENYARELLQLFTIGLVQLNQDGTPVLDSNGIPLPTYNQDTIEAFAHVFTGWHFANADHFIWPTQKDYISPMVPYENYHDNSEKTLLNGFVIPAGTSATDELNMTLDHIFNHPNVGPFIAKQLIQKLVTSNPTPGYVADVASVFNANEDGIRGSMASVIKAILLHDEARNGHKNLPTTFGKLKEPVLRITSIWRAFPPEVVTDDFNYAYSDTEIGQAVLNAPSVFNFFTPGFSQPGTIRSEGLVSPEFQMLDESTIIRLTSRLLMFSVHSHNYKYESDQHRMALNIAREVAMESRSPDELINHLDMLLLGGDMSPELRTIAKELMQSYDYINAGPQRVVEAIFLIISSPEGAIQK